jgi:hypothetical protein
MADADNCRSAAPSTYAAAFGGGGTKTFSAGGRGAVSADGVHLAKRGNR